MPSACGPLHWKSGRSTVRSLSGAIQRRRALQRAEFLRFCTQTGASRPLRRHGWRDCDGKATALSGCPVPLRLRSVYTCLRPCRSPLASACALVCPAISLTTQVKRLQATRPTIFPRCSLRSCAFVVVGACTLHPSFRSCCQLGPCRLGLPRADSPPGIRIRPFSSSSSHSSALNKRAPRSRRRRLDRCMRGGTDQSTAIGGRTSVRSSCCSK